MYGNSIPEFVTLFIIDIDFSKFSLQFKNSCINVNFQANGRESTAARIYRISVCFFIAIVFNSLIPC